ncbi:Peroxisome biogenesis factor 1 [Brachionus plicatilis]|uniref:Peroxisome biogenesis factor 1 n=1 Tax=Brachionus plicatilis TaxID=10195 RepID=A0A3M7P2G0_BRAPC|nr:Peroxisome biogenesis factor 1 [Brachionus plicatilis]
MNSFLFEPILRLSLLLVKSKMLLQNIKSAFVNFIDQQSECLCPIVLTNETLLHLPFQNETIKCLISLKSDLVTISSTTLLNNLLKLDIEIVPAAELDKFEIDLKHLSRNTFNIDLIKPKWFEANLKSILSFLNTSFLPDSSSQNRNIIIQGSSGSGKTILCKSLCNSLPNTIYFYINCQTFISKTADTIFDQLKLIYQETLWYENKPCLVILENIDLLVENKNNNTDPSSFLYYSQIVEVLKQILLSVWQSKNICTIVTSSTALSELPSIFHCLDEHEVVEHVASQCDGFVFKDIEKLIDKIIFSIFEPNCSSVLSLDENLVKLVYNYTPINMIETKFYKSRAELSWDSIGGHERAKSSLIETLIWPIKYRNLYCKFLMKQSSGVLLYGPSGCGKTLIASAVANESKFNFLSVKGPEILSKYIGNSEQNVRDLFRKAQKAKPCIIFFDEFDSVAPKRGHDSTGVTDRVVNQLLTQLDGIEQLDGVYLLAATSRPDLIDQALLRPGRIDSYLYIDYPSKSELEKIFQIYCANVKVSDDVDWKDVAGYCEFFSGADVKSAICDALIKAFHKVEKEKCEQDILESIILDKGVLMSSLDSIRDSINLNERKKLKKKYQNNCGSDTLDYKTNLFAIFRDIKHYFVFVFCSKIHNVPNLTEFYRMSILVMQKNKRLRKEVYSIRVMDIVVNNDDGSLFDIIS